MGFFSSGSGCGSAVPVSLSMALSPEEIAKGVAGSVPSTLNAAAMAIKL